MGIDRRFYVPAFQSGDKLGFMPDKSKLGVYLSAGIKAEYETIREQHGNRREKTRMSSIEDARANKFKTDWDSYTPAKPNFVGVKSWEDFDLNLIRNYIDWTPFFSTWELSLP